MHAFTPILVKNSTINVIGIKQIYTITKNIKPSKRASYLRKIGENIRKHLKK
jgi:hypothetical protein